MTAVKWKNPPAPRKGRPPSPAIDDLVARLKKRPGQWALVIEGAKSAGSGGVFTRRGCEVRSVMPDYSGRRDIYARYPEAK